jgi:uncharacterized OB-fold protein
MGKPKVPAIDGWFRLPEDDADNSIVLVGTRCADSGTYYFPPERVMSRAPGFADSVLEEVELSTRGVLWSFTDAQYQPPEPYMTVTDPYAPFCIAAVHLEVEQIVVLGQVIAGVGVDDLEVGMEMELVADTLFTDDEVEHMIWKWQPIGTSGSAAASEEAAS